MTKPPCEEAQVRIMDDYISRQAAIDAVCKVCYMEEDYHKCDGYPETSTWCEELVALRDLPSAQPEIIRCKDCMYWDKSWANDWGKDYHYCIMVDSVRKGDFYCADAERETDEID